MNRSDQRVSSFHLQRREHLQLVQLPIRPEQTFQRVNMACEPKVLRLIHTELHRQTPRRRITICEMCLNILKRVLRKTMLTHDLLPGIVVLRLLRPVDQRPRKARFVRGSVAQRRGYVSRIDGCDLALVEFGAGVSGASVPSSQFWPQAVVWQRAAVTCVEFLVSAFVF
jgi:hypothetical protein